MHKLHKYLLLYTSKILEVGVYTAFLLQKRPDVFTNVYPHAWHIEYMNSADV